MSEMCSLGSTKYTYNNKTEISFFFSENVQVTPKVSFSDNYINIL